MCIKLVSEHVQVSATPCLSVSCNNVKIQYKQKFRICNKINIETATPELECHWLDIIQSKNMKTCPSM